MTSGLDIYRAAMRDFSKPASVLFISNQFAQKNTH